jgi:hypothetical protein
MHRQRGVDAANDAERYDGQYDGGYDGSVREVPKLHIHPTASQPAAMRAAEGVGGHVGVGVGVGVGAEAGCRDEGDRGVETVSLPLSADSNVGLFGSGGCLGSESKMETQASFSSSEDYPSSFADSAGLNRSPPHGRMTMNGDADHDTHLDTGRHADRVWDEVPLDERRAMEKKLEKKFSMEYRVRRPPPSYSEVLRHSLNEALGREPRAMGDRQRGRQHHTSRKGKGGMKDYCDSEHRPLLTFSLESINHWDSVGKNAAAAGGGVGGSVGGLISDEAGKTSRSEGDYGTLPEGSYPLYLRAPCEASFTPAGYDMIEATSPSPPSDEYLVNYALLSHIRAAFLEVIRTYYFKVIRQGGLQRDTYTVRVLLTSVDHGLERLHSPGLQDWIFIRSILKRPTASWRSWLWGLWRCILFVRDAEYWDEEHRVLILINYINAHRYAQRKIPSHFGESDVIDTREQAVAIAESNFSVNEANEELDTIDSSAIQLHKSKQIVLNMFHLKENLTMEMQEEGILNDADSEILLDELAADRLTIDRVFRHHRRENGYNGRSQLPKDNGVCDEMNGSHDGRGLAMRAGGGPAFSAALAETQDDTEQHPYIRV